MERHNQRFAIALARRADLHRKLTASPEEFDGILCHREQRRLGEQLTLHYDRKQFILEQTALAKRLAGHYVDVYEYTDRPVELRWQGQLLPHRIFDKNQRVNETAIVENKRLGPLLAKIKAQQDLRDQTRVLTISQKQGDVKNPRRKYGPDYVEKNTRARSSGDVEIAKSRRFRTSPPHHDG